MLSITKPELVKLCNAKSNGPFSKFGRISFISHFAIFVFCHTWYNFTNYHLFYHLWYCNFDPVSIFSICGIILPDLKNKFLFHKNISSQTQETTKRKSQVRHMFISIFRNMCIHLHENSYEITKFYGNKNLAYYLDKLGRYLDV